MDVSYFDLHASSGHLMQGLNDDCVSIQKAIGEKVGNTMHHVATFATGIAIGQPLPPSLLLHPEGQLPRFCFHACTVSFYTDHCAVSWPKPWSLGHDEAGSRARVALHTTTVHMEPQAPVRSINSSISCSVISIHHQLQQALHQPHRPGVLVQPSQKAGR